MKSLLKCLTVVIVLAIASVCAADSEELYHIVVTDVYDFNLMLKVPQVLNNTISEGRRVYRHQRIRGNMYVQWYADGSFNLAFDGLTNHNFSVGGKKVTYTGYEGIDTIYTRYCYIGNNKTELFKKPCLSFYLELEPSYAIGGNNEDNSFYLMLAGTGNSTNKSEYKSRIARNFYGYASGTQGCGCSAYTHKSPTRQASPYGPSDTPTDVVATFGTWRARWKRRLKNGGLALLR